MMFLSEELPIIVEIGVNHEGNINSAIKMMRIASEAGAKIVKFQSYTPLRYAAADNAERLTRVSKFSLDISDFVRLKKEADRLNMIMLSTPLTEDWVEKLSPLCPAFKIASGDVTFKPVIEKAAATGKDLIISTGAANIEEIDRAVTWVRSVIGEENLKKKLTLMHCVAAYPTPIDQANVLSVPFLKERYGLSVGYSNHVIGMSACLSAVALGADIIEVHFTDCKEGREFRDHALSFDPTDLKNFIEVANNLRLSLGVWGKELQSCEKEGVNLLRKGIIAGRDLFRGDTITAEDIMFARPSVEFSSNELHLVLGKVLKQDVRKGFLIKRDAV